LEATKKPVTWPLDIYATFKRAAITQIAYVPDAGHTQLIKSCEADAQMKTVSLTAEQEGVGVVTGQWLGGSRAMIAMQSSGVGNCINALGIPVTMRTPCLMLVTMRGQWGEFNPWQVPMGQATRTVLEAVGVRCFPVERAEEIGEVFAAAADIAFNSTVSAAVLVSQRVIGAKGFGQK